MSKVTEPGGDRLYSLLPAIYRVRDAAEGEPLRALMAVMERELELLESDIDRLYDNWFIETCDEWAVPYIGDLLGVRGLHAVRDGSFSQRAWVANTLRYRRRKGTAAVVEQLARDVTGWPARAVELFRLLGTTQYITHVRPALMRTPDLRDTNRLELLGGPFDQTAHTVDIRRIGSGRGLYNIPNFGLFLWRLQSYPLTRANAASKGAGQYTFDPLGRDTALFNRPQTETDIAALADEVNTPGLLRRRALYDELEERRRAAALGGSLTARYFGKEPVLEVYLGPAAEAVKPEHLLICDLSGWEKPEFRRDYVDADGALHRIEAKAAVDPRLGRLLLGPAAGSPPAVEVSYAYGFSGDIGGGPYDRQESAEAVLRGPITWQVGVSGDPALVDNVTVFERLKDAVDAWNLCPAGNVGAIVIMDSRTHQTEDCTIQIKEGSQLLMAAAAWPAGRPVGRFVADRVRPLLEGKLQVKGLAPSGSQSFDGFALNGVLLAGSVQVLAGNLGHLDIAHATIVPGTAGIKVSGSGNGRLQVSLTRSICGPLQFPTSGASGGMNLVAMDSIVSSGAAGNAAKAAVRAPLAAVRMEAVTLLGTATAWTLEASNSILSGTVQAQLRQTGCVRFCYLTRDSRAPRPYRCVTDQDGRPAFASSIYGDPGYGKLSRACPEPIRREGEDQGEMGAFRYLQQPLREANLRTSLEEYLRMGLKAGLIFVNESAP